MVVVVITVVVVSSTTRTEGNSHVLGRKRDCYLQDGEKGEMKRFD